MRGKNDRHNAKRRGNDTDEEVKREKKQKKREAKKNDRMHDRKTAIRIQNENDKKANGKQ